MAQDKVNKIEAVTIEDETPKVTQVSTKWNDVVSTEIEYGEWAPKYIKDMLIDTSNPMLVKVRIFWDWRERNIVTCNYNNN